MTKQDRTAKDIAFSLLQRREHTSGELKRKLAARGVGAEEIEILFSRLVELGLLDDRRAGKLLVRTELRKHPMGRARLTAKLRQRGLSQSLISECLEGFDENWEANLAQEAAALWLKRKVPSAKWKEALARHLRNRGFAWGSVRVAIDGLSSDMEEVESQE